MSISPCVQVVEDDTSLCRALSLLFASVGLDSRCYHAPRVFLEI